MKKQHPIMLTFFLWASSLLCLTVGVSSSDAKTASLKDIADSYARAEIQSLYQAGIVLGDADGYYHPKQPVTRAEFVAMLTRTWGLLPVKSQYPAYVDVPKSSWAYGPVQAAVSLGIANGTTATTFSPNRTISRQEAAALLIRALQDEPAQPHSLPLHDARDVAGWARPYVHEVIRQKILVGYQGYFRPNAALSREETAVILSRLKTKAGQGASAKQPIILGWQYQTSTQEFIDLIKDSPVNTLSPRWYYLQADGSVSDHTDAAIVRWAHQNGRKVWALFGNRFDAKATHEMLTSPAKRAAVIAQLEEFSVKYQWDGVNVDFENIKPEDRYSFTLFVKELTAALHKKGLKVSVDVPPDSQSDWSAPYDYVQLGKIADYIVLMGYEEHWSRGPAAGSVSSVPWLVKASDHLLSLVPPQKFITGLPLYTRDWYRENGTLLSRDLLILESYRLLAQTKPTLKWDPAVSQYKAVYAKNGIMHSLWLEESRSIGAKLRASMDQPIAGFAFWYVGEPLPDVWNVISNAWTLHKWKTSGTSS